VGVALLNQHAAVEVGGGFRGTRVRPGRKALQQLAEPRAVDAREVARYESPAALGSPAALAEGDYLVAGERLEVLVWAEDRTPEGMVPVGGAAKQGAGHGRRLVVVASDLLDHHAALALELVRVDAGSPDVVGEQVGRLHDHLGPAVHVKGHHVVRREGVDLRAQTLGRVHHVAIAAVALAPLEHEVLEEVRDAVLLGVLRACAGVEGDEKSHRPRAAHAKPHERQAVVQNALLDRDHDA
jgi:hypothetical protein